MEDENGCISTDTLLIRLIIKDDIYIPNIFSPNGDNINDRWVIFGADDGIKINEVQVFDRWGEKVYEEVNLQANQNSKGWDGIYNGEKVNPGVYVYRIQYINNKGKEVMLSGGLTIIR